MRLLLDTHALVWWSTGDDNLSSRAAEAILDTANIKIVSAATIWEIATKHRLGKLPEAADLARDPQGYLEEQGFAPLDVTIAHARLGGSLASEHRDPFDRILIAQTIIEGLTLVSNERLFDSFSVSRLW